MAAAAGVTTPRRTWLWLIVLLLAAVAIYGNALPNPYLADDEKIIARNPTVREPSAIGLKKLWTLPYWKGVDAGGQVYPLGEDPAIYRPIVVFTYWLNGWFTTAPAGFRLVNVGLHGLASFVLGLWVRRWFGGTAGLVASAAVLIHPLGTEVINRIVGRADILVLLGVGGFLAAQRAAQLEGWTWGRTTAAGLAAVVALGAKESGAALVPLALLQAWAGGPTSRAWRGALALGVPLGLYTAGRLVALATWLPRPPFFHLPGYVPNAAFDLLGNPLVGKGLAERLPATAALTLYYARLMFCPWPLAAFDVPRRAPGWSEPSFHLGPIVLPAAAGLLLLAVVVVSLVVLAVRRHPLALAPGWWLCSFLLVAQLITPIGAYSETRLAYPMLGSLALAAGWLATRAAFAPRVGRIVAACVAAAGLGLIVRRNVEFRSMVTLLEAEAARKPDDAPTLLRLGQAYFDVGEERRTSDERRAWLRKADETLTRVTVLAPRSSQAWCELGLFYDAFAEALGGPEDAAKLEARALACYRRAITLNAKNTIALNALAEAALSAGDLESAERLLAEAHAAAPDDPFVRSNLALLEMSAGRWERAIEGLSAVAREFPNLPQVAKLRDEFVAVRPAAEAAAQGDVARAIALLRAELTRRPDSEIAAQLLENYASGMGTQQGR